MQPSVKEIVFKLPLLFKNSSLGNSGLGNTEVVKLWRQGYKGILDSADKPPPPKINEWNILKANTCQLRPHLNFHCGFVDKTIFLPISEGKKGCMLSMPSVYFQVSQ